MARELYASVICSRAHGLKIVKGFQRGKMSKFQGIIPNFEFEMEELDFQTRKTRLPCHPRIVGEFSQESSMFKLTITWKPVKCS